MHSRVLAFVARGNFSLLVPSRLLDTLNEYTRIIADEPMLEIRKRIIPNCLRSYRKARGLLQKEVAAVLGFKSASIVSRWENGVYLPSSLTMFKLAVLYRTMVDALFVDLRRALKNEILRAESAVVGDRVSHDKEKQA